MKAKIRKLATFVEETCTEMGRQIQPPTRRAAAVAVIENPCAGKYVEDLNELMEIGEELGQLLTERAVAALGIPGPSAESYGKAAAVHCREWAAWRRLRSRVTTGCANSPFPVHASPVECFGFAAR